MKEKATQIAIILLSVIVFFTGMGTTIAHFCCNDCVENFYSFNTPVVQEHEKESCCNEQTAQHNQKNNDQHPSKEECCTIERKSVDLQSSHPTIQVTVPYTWISADLGFLVNQTTQYFAPDIRETKEYPPQIFEPRSYLAFVGVLII